MENVQVKNTPKLTKKQATDLRIQKAIAESEKAIKDNPQWYDLDEVLEDMRKI